LKKSSTKNFNVGSFFNKETRSVSVKSFEGVRGNFFKSFPEKKFVKKFITKKFFFYEKFHKEDFL